MFTTLIVQPIFNLLVLIYAIIPGHNFGLAIILFTVVIRLAMTPLIRKQLRHTTAMRSLQPELKKIKAQTKGNRQLESQMVMELYKERQISPFGSIGIVLIQVVLIYALFVGLNRVIKDNQELITHAYGFIQNLPWMKELAANPSVFDNTLFGFIDLSRAAIGSQGFYFWAFLLVVGSAVTQYFQIQQTMPINKDARKLRHILKDAGGGKTADSEEINAAIGRSMAYFLPVMILFLTVGFAAALSLYWFTSGLVGYYQQKRILKQDEVDLTNLADKTDKKEAIEGEVIEKKVTRKKPKTKKKSSKSNKRRKR